MTTRLQLETKQPWWKKKMTIFLSSKLEILSRVKVQLLKQQLSNILKVQMALLILNFLCPISQSIPFQENIEPKKTKSCSISGLLWNLLMVDLVKSLILKTSKFWSKKWIQQSFKKSTVITTKCTRISKLASGFNTWMILRIFYYIYLWALDYEPYAYLIVLDALGPVWITPPVDTLLKGLLLVLNDEEFALKV